MKKKDKNEENLLKAVGLMKLLAHPVRLSVMCNLVHNNEMSVTDLELAEEGRVSQSQLSQFLGRMRSEGLVTFRKEGQVTIYSIASDEAKAVVKTLYKIYCGK